MRRFVFLQQQSVRTSSAEYLLSKRFPTNTALLQSSHKDQFLQPNVHHRSQEAEDLCPQHPLPVEHTESKEEQSMQHLNRLQKTNTEIQSTPTDLVPPSSSFLSTPDDHHELYSFLNQNKQPLLFNEQRLNEGQQN